MRNEITFTKVENEKQLVAHNLDDFASSFDHHVSRLFPIWIGHIDGRLMTYCHLHSHVVAYPAVHPSITQRQMYRLGHAWLSRIKEMHGDPLVAMPRTGQKELWSKIGLKPFNKEVYVISD